MVWGKLSFLGQAPASACLGEMSALSHCCFPSYSGKAQTYRRLGPAGAPAGATVSEREGEEALISQCLDHGWCLLLGEIPLRHSKLNWWRLKFPKF